MSLRRLALHAAVSALAVTFALAAQSDDAAAGRRLLNWTVTLDPNAMMVQGNLGAVFNSPDPTEHIGCNVWFDTNTGRNTVNCYAGDAKGQSMTCNSDNPDLVQIALAIREDTYLTVYWDANNTCTSIAVSLQSMFEPKKW
jgi:hypothetical protein